MGKLTIEWEDVKRKLFEVSMFGIGPHEARSADSVKSETYPQWRKDLKKNFFNKKSVEFCLITQHPHNKKLHVNDPLFVRAAHIIPKNYARLYYEKFGDTSFKTPFEANSVRNGLFMIKLLEDAFDAYRFCIVPDALHEGDYLWYILDESLKDELAFYGIIIESEGKLLFPQEPGSYPYRRSLYCQALYCVENALKKEWIDSNHALANLEKFYEPSLLELHEKRDNSKDAEDKVDS